MQTLIVFVEGLAGSGKTRTAEFIGESADNRRIKVEVFTEYSEYHPIHSVAFSSYLQWVKEVRAKWLSLVETIQMNKRLTIFESTLFQNTIGLLLEKDINEEDIMRYAEQVPQALSALNPALIYYTLNDVERHIRTLYRLRSKKWQRKIDTFIQSTAFGKSRNLEGLDGYIHFNRELKKINDRIFEKLPFRKTSIDISYSQWQFYQKMAEEFVFET